MTGECGYDGWRNGTAFCNMEPDGEGMVPCPDCTPAETTAGEREAGGLHAPPTSADEPGGLYELARDNTFMRAINFGIDDFRMGRQSNVALAESLAKAALASPALAALLDRVRREEGERIAQAIEGQRITCPDHSIPDCSPMLNGCSAVIRLHARLAVDASIARAASVGRGEGL